MSDEPEDDSSLATASKNHELSTMNHLMPSFRNTWPVLFGLTVLCNACASGGNVQTYSGRGRIVSVEDDRCSAMIEHEEIAGFMPAMTMLFRMKDASLLEGLTPDDLVKFELIVTETESWISKMEKTGRAEPKESVPPSAPPVPSGLVLKPGDIVPDFTLTDQDERKVSLSTFRGQPVAITFIFTRCPMPEYCPRFSGNFAAVQKELARRSRGQFRLLSISFDPEYDTPKILREYGLAYGADFRFWSFLTGSPEGIEQVTSHFGVNYWDDNESISHTSACAVITSNGTLFKLYRGNSWTAEDVIGDLTTLNSS
jgi:protein SCO1